VLLTFYLIDCCSSADTFTALSTHDRATQLLPCLSNQEKE
jgi:hypothetical protein